MKMTYWFLAFVLGFAMFAYFTTKDSVSNCEPVQIKRRFLE